MNFLARAVSSGARYASGASRLLGRAAPATRFLARALPGALDTAARFSTNPAVQAAVQRIGGDKGTSVLRSLAGGVSNAQAGINLAGGVVRDARSAYGATQNAFNAAKPAATSLARLMNTSMGKG